MFFAKNFPRKRVRWKEIIPVRVIVIRIIAKWFSVNVCRISFRATAMPVLFLSIE
mgnify:CR=1 FL=1